MKPLRKFPLRRKIVRKKVIRYSRKPPSSLAPTTVSRRNARATSAPSKTVKVQKTNPLFQKAGTVAQVRSALKTIRKTESVNKFKKSIHGLVAISKKAKLAKHKLIDDTVKATTAFKQYVNPDTAKMVAYVAPRVGQVMTQASNVAGLIENSVKTLEKPGEYPLGRLNQLNKKVALTGEKGMTPGGILPMGVETLAISGLN